MTNELVSRDADRRGVDDIDQTELALPSAILLQGLSPQVSDEALDLKAGQIISSVSSEVLPANFVPLFRSYHYEINDTADNKRKVLFKTKDIDAVYENKTMREWVEHSRGSDGSAVTGQRVLNVLALFGEKLEPSVIKFKRTSSYAGQGLLQMAKGTAGPMFNNWHTLSSKKVEAKHTYYIYTTKIGSVLTNDAYTEVSKVYDKFAPNKDRIEEAVSTGGTLPDEETFN